MPRSLSDRRPGAVRPLTASVLAAVVAANCLVTASCVRAINGTPGRVTSAIDTLPPTGPVPVVGGTGTPTDALAAQVVTGVEDFWRQEFPTVFGRPWVNIHGYYAVDPRIATGPPPCVKRAPDLDDQAVYCAERDTVAWDRVGLLPRLAGTDGPGAVVVTLAHEMGHAVQNRLGIDATAHSDQPDRLPTILVEGMADCYAGSAMRAVISGRIPNVRISRPELDLALRALLSFRDPIAGVGTGLAARHGDAFDRVSAFIDGYTTGPMGCAGMTVRNQLFTQRGYTSRLDQARGGDLPLPTLLRWLGPDLAAWFGQLVAGRGHQWRAPELVVDGTGGCAATLGRLPARFCSRTGTVAVSSRALGAVHDTLGDYASGTVLASRYALAALAALDRPVRGPDAADAALCLVGAYTRAVFDRAGGLTLSPGDIDEAVNELLRQDFAGRDADADPPADALGFERVGRFRAGVLGGAAGCGV